MLSIIDIEKYKMLISAMPEDKVIEAIEILKEAMKDGAESLKTLQKMDKLITQNVNACIVRNEKGLEGEDLTKYDVVIFDCNIRDVTDFSNCPKKMIFKGDIDWSGKDFEKLPDISESIVYGSFDCSRCKNITSLEGSPREVDGYFYCNGCRNLTSFKGAPRKLGESELKLLEDFPKKVGDNFNCSNEAQEVKATDTKVNLVNLKKFGGDGR